MGQRNARASAEILSAVDKVCESLERTAKPKYVWREFPLELSGDRVIIDGHIIESKRLAAHLNGCKDAAILAATLGTEADIIIRRNFALGTVNGTAAQAAGAAMIEQVLDNACEEIAASSGLSTKSRFSPGYGDLGLDCQHLLLTLCDATKRIGITLTDSLMMIPTKSVTAIVGLCEDNSCENHSCEQCDKKDCDFRR